MVTTRDRYQFPVLGDTLRLKNFVSSSGLPLTANFASKVEVKRLTQQIVDLTYDPEAQFLVSTVVNHRRAGVDSEIKAYPDYISSPEYYYTDLYLDPSSFGVGDYADRWYVILDDSIWLEDWTAVRGTSADEYSHAGQIQTYRIAPSKGRKITPAGIKDTASATSLTLADISSDGSTPPPTLLNVPSTSIVGAVRAPIVGDPTQTVGTGLNDVSTSGVFTGPSDITYQIEITSAATPDVFKWSDDNWATEHTGVNCASSVTLDRGVVVSFAATTGHTSGDRWSFTAVPDELIGWIRADSSDGESWQALYFEVVAKAPSVNTVWVTYGSPASDGDHPGYSTYDVGLNWSTVPLSSGVSLTSIEWWYVHQWDVDSDVEYDVDTPNPWDDAWERADPTLKMTSEHRFSIAGALAYGSDSPADFQIGVSMGQNRFQLGERGYITIKASAGQIDPAIERYYRRFVEVSTATFKIFAVGTKGELELIKEATADAVKDQAFSSFIDTTTWPYMEAGTYGAQLTLSTDRVTKVSDIYPFAVVDATKLGIPGL